MILCELNKLIVLEATSLTEISRAGDKFCGQWHFDSVNKEWIGNPVWSTEVEDILEACKYKDGESKQTHSKAMSVGDMTKLHDYATSQCLSLEISVAQQGFLLLFIALASTGQLHISCDWCKWNISTPN